MYAIQTPKTDDKVDFYTDKAVIACRQNTFVWNSGAERVCKMKTSVWKHQETFPFLRATIEHKLAFRRHVEASKKPKEIEFRSIIGLRVDFYICTFVVAVKQFLEFFDIYVDKF